MSKKINPDGGNAGEQNSSTQGHGILFTRFLWAMAGPVFWLVALAALGKERTWLGVWDLVFAGVVVTMLAGRYAEQRTGHGTTLYGETSTWPHVRRYAVQLAVVSVLAWAVLKYLVVPR